MNAPARLFGSQFAYDMAEPEFGPEIDLEPMVEDLMHGQDSELLSFEGFAAAAQEHLDQIIADMDDPYFLLRLVLRCEQSKDSQLSAYVDTLTQSMTADAYAALNKTLAKECRS